MFSQGDEEAAILKYFGNAPTGRLLDIGAWEGMTFSNTRMLIEMGWGGVMVEPSAHSFDCMLRNYRRFGDRVEMVCAAVVPSAPPTGLATFWQTDDATSTTVAAHMNKWIGQGVPYDKTHVGAISVAQLLAAFPGPYDFVNIDAEGVSVEIASEMLARTKATLWCVETDDSNARTELMRMAESGGLRQVHMTGNNLLFGR